MKLAMAGAVAVLALSSSAHAAPPLDLGARGGVALPVGAFDASTRAGATTFGGTPFAIDAAFALGGNERWAVAAGALARWMPTVPRLCGSTSDCVSSLGRDLEVGLLVRVYGPKVWRVFPEAELGFGWSWSQRQLVDEDATSTRRWSGPVVLRTALIPTFALGRRTRLGILFATALERSSSFDLEAPGIRRSTTPVAAFHGTVELGVRFGFDFFSAAAP